MTMNIDRFDSYLAEGRLIRHEWTGNDAEGRATACWLAALFDEVSSSESPASCPADQLPQWLAYLIPWMDDKGTKKRWRGFAERLSAVLKAPRTADQWHRAEYAVRALCVRDAMRHTDDASVLEVCSKVVDLCELVAAGEAHNSKNFRDARGEFALYFMTACTMETEYAARSAAAAAEGAAVSDAARGAAAAATISAAPSLRRKTADRLIDGILTVLEEQ
jgi:hypothetical protein